MSGAVIHRNDTAANLASLNRVYARGEEVYEYNTGKKKIGDGVTPWNLLQYEDDKFLARTSTQRLKGVIDASGNPNYPTAKAGETWVISVAGKIGGASGVTVDVADILLCVADTAAGNQATVGANWIVTQANLVGALLAANNLSDIANPATARTNLGIPALLDSLLYGNAAGTFGVIQGNLFKNAQVEEGRVSLASGNNTIYTVPPGYKLIYFFYGLFNPTGGTIGHYLQIQSGSDYFRLPTNFTALYSLTTNTGNGFLTAQGSHLVAGESFVMNANAAGTNMWYHAIIVPDTVGIVPFRYNGAFTANTAIPLYTCPTGKKAYLLGSLQNPGVQSSGQVSIMNISGASVTSNHYLVKSGESAVAGTNRIFAQATGNNGGSVLNFQGYLHEGDSYQVDLQSTVASGLVSITGSILEIDA